MLHNNVDHYMRASRTIYNANRFVDHHFSDNFTKPLPSCSWIGMRLDILGQLFAMSLAFYLVYGGASADPSTVGFLLSVAGMSTYPLKMFTDPIAIS